MTLKDITGFQNSQRLQFEQLAHVLILLITKPLL